MMNGEAAAQHLIGKHVVCCNCTTLEGRKWARQVSIAPRRPATCCYCGVDTSFYFGITTIKYAGDQLHCGQPDNLEHRPEWLVNMILRPVN